LNVFKFNSIQYLNPRCRFRDGGVREYSIQFNISILGVGSETEGLGSGTTWVAELVLLPMLHLLV